VSGVELNFDGGHHLVQCDIVKLVFPAHYILLCIKSGATPEV
jgi:hypothetical protein